MNWEQQHAIDRQRIDALERELDEARERIRQLEQLNFNVDWLPPIELGLTPGEGRVLATLVGTDGLCTTERFMAALYSLNPGDPPQEKIIDVFICKIRRKLKPHGVEIVTRWAHGYEMPAASKAICNAWGKASA